MSNPEDIKKAVANIEPTQSLIQLIQKSTKEIGRALPQHLNPERMVRIALTCIRTNSELAKCTPESFMGALFTASQCGLEPVAGRAYLLPFNNSRKIAGQYKTIKEVQFIIGYKGYCDLFYRHESALSIDMHTVYEKDEFSYEYGTKAFLKHRPADKLRGAAIGFYVIAKLKAGGELFKYMTYDDCMEHGRTHSKTWDKGSNKFFDYSPWAKEPEAMCKKTVLFQLAKTLPLSIELQRAIQADETSREYKQGIDEALDLKDVTNWNDEEKDAQKYLDEQKKNGENQNQKGDAK